MDEHPLVSIVLPTYNGSRYLMQSIRSCLDQTYANLELVVVDDCSTDETPCILRAVEDPRVRVLRHDRNRGLPEALNTGFRCSRGEMLTWTSDDNKYASDALEVMVSVLTTQPDVAFVYTDYWRIDEDDRVLEMARVGPPETLPESDCVGACFLYRREVYAMIGEYNPRARLVEDYEYWLRVSRQFPMVPLHRPLYYYRVHRASLTNTWGSHTVWRAANRMKRELGLMTRAELQREMARVDIDEGFLSIQNDHPTKARYLLLRGVLRNPIWLKNRGVISVLLHSFGLRRRRLGSDHSESLDN